MRRKVSISLIICLGASLACVSKNYVRNQVTPLINKTNELDDLTAKNTKDIKELDQRVQGDIQQAPASASAADQKAQVAAKQAQQAQAQADNAARRVDTLQKVVANSDSYRVVNEAAVQFGINRSDLTNAAKTELDQLATNRRNLEDNIIVIKGFTDSTGSTDDNASLSNQRANTVRRYLVTQYNVPTYKIYMVGLGEGNPVASNKTQEGRAKNRRAIVQLMSNAVAGPLTAGHP